MELLFQAWDELDDALAALRHVVVRYAVGDFAGVAANVLGALRKIAREAGFTREAAVARRRSFGARTA
ncbi:MAG TPA: hypothetical protein VF339_14380 [Gammaproteobacteria bacterium]